MLGEGDFQGEIVHLFSFYLLTDSPDMVSFYMASQATTKMPIRRPRKDELALANLVKELNMEPITLEATQSVFDLDTKSDVTLYKQVTFTPATSAKEALEAVGNDSDTFLKIINAGLRDYTREQAAGNDSLPWQAKDEEGNLVPFSGTTISEEKSKQLAANVLNMAKMIFGYSKDLSRDEKRVAKDKAQDMILSNPAVVEALKK